jgi:hypothetical protein
MVQNLTFVESVLTKGPGYSLHCGVMGRDSIEMYICSFLTKKKETACVSFIGFLCACVWLLSS